MARYYKWRLLTLAILVAFIVTGCNTKKEAGSEEVKPTVPKAATAPAADSKEGLPVPEIPAAASMVEPTTLPGGNVAEVNGVKFAKSRFDVEMKRKLALLKEQVPADRLDKLKPDLRKQILDDFIIKTLLAQEAKSLKIEATEKEVTDAMDQIKASLPPGASLEELLKKNDLSGDKFREEMTLGVKINKLVLSQPLAKAKPTEKEVSKYYQDNKEKFKAPETVRARHILVAKGQGDDAKAEAEKKAKAETLRKQLLEGGDFAELAAKNSDCPSKSSGGDLGTFPRGQMVKPFEEAAFSQKVNAIGAVVETDFGYHVIQVLARNESKVISLDNKIREEIGIFIQQQRRQEAFNELLKKLRAKATILIAGQ